MSYRIIFILILALSTGCKPRTSQGFNALSETEKNARWLDAQGYSITRPQEYLARADSALAAERNAKNYCWKGRALGLEGKHRESLAYLDSALALAGDDAELLSYYHSCKALAYLKLGETAKERAEYQAIIDLGAEGYVDEAKESLARSYYHDGKYKEALEALPDSLSLEGQQYYRLITNDLGIQDEESDYVKLEHIWKPIDKARFMLAAPSNGEVSSWEKGFEKANQIDSVWRDDLKVYGNARRYIAVNDFLEAWQGEYRSLNDNYRQTEWRLLQYDTTVAVPGSVFDKVFHLKDVYEDILDYDTGVVYDLTNQAWLALNFRYYYVSILYDVIRGCVNAKAREALRSEQALAERYHSIMADTYTKIDGQPDGMNGSSYQYRCGVIGMQDYDMEIEALELFMKFLAGEATEVESVSITREDVINTFDTFASTLEDDEYSFSVEERKAALMKARNAWTAWLDARKKVSDLFDGEVKEAYDRVTARLCHHQLVTLKNEFL